MQLSPSRALRVIPLLGVLALGACAPGYVEVGPAYGPGYATSPVVVPAYPVGPRPYYGHRPPPHRHFGERRHEIERRAEWRAEQRARERREEWRNRQNYERGHWR